MSNAIAIPSPPDGPFILPIFERESGGVDFLGLRQVNLDLMAECLPGINNTTRHIRPFSVLCWIHWQFQAQMVASGAEEASGAESRLFQEKAETLFTWGHQINDLGGVPGRRAKCPEVSGGWVGLNFKEWNRSAQNTSLQAPVQYGPAMKSRYGLGFADPVGPNLHRVSETGATLAEALDRRLRRSSSYPLLCDLAAKKGRRADAYSLFPAWRVDEPSKGESSIFAPAYFNETQIDAPGSLAVRSTTLQSVREVLRASKQGMSEEDVRMALAYQRFLSGQKINLSTSGKKTARKWLVLQVRQAQRAALEGLLSWLEWRMASIPRIEMARTEIVRILGNEGRRQCRTILRDFANAHGDLSHYMTASAKNGPDCIFRLVDELFGAIGEDVNRAVVVSARLLVVTSGLTQWMLQEPDCPALLQKGGAERVSLAHQLKHIENRGDLTLGSWLGEVIETWVIGQHLKFATYRFDGGTRRLRFAFDEDGLEFLAEKPSSPIVSLDHLSAALSLMAEAGLVAFDPDTEEFSV